MELVDVTVAGLVTLGTPDLALLQVEAQPWYPAARILIVIGGGFLLVYIFMKLFGE